MPSVRAWLASRAPLEPWRSGPEGRAQRLGQLRDRAGVQAGGPGFTEAELLSRSVEGQAAVVVVFDQVALALGQLRQGAAQGPLRLCALGRRRWIRRLLVGDIADARMVERDDEDRGELVEGLGDLAQGLLGV